MSLAAIAGAASMPLRFYHCKLSRASAWTQIVSEKTLAIASPPGPSTASTRSPFAVVKAATVRRCYRTVRTPPGNAVKHFIAVGREPSGVWETSRDRRACALPLTPHFKAVGRKPSGVSGNDEGPEGLRPAANTSSNAGNQCSQRCPPGQPPNRLHLQCSGESFSSGEITASTAARTSA
ncbi:hypothetical protein TBK1r_71470 [Stieleria magnilauensis]|uniref:Uncharacterized protein n=1 Tax=Stieleria magnilauensis TaxID=2527963 RepID=A0ABX5Y2X8_9BACT|nr:hypothetical protein TBK1r_71470 [Planctomycetes bacterium TBK1r]